MNWGIALFGMGMLAGSSWADGGLGSQDHGRILLYDYPVNPTNLQDRYKGRSTSELLQNLKNLEKTCILADIPTQRSVLFKKDGIRARHKALVAVLDARLAEFTKAAGVGPDSPKWVAYLNSLPLKQRLEAVELSYAANLARVAAAEGKHPIEKAQDIISVSSPESKADLETFLNITRSTSPEALEGVQDKEVKIEGGRSIAGIIAETKLRRDFAQNGKKAALGYAVGTCSMTLSAHAFDQPPNMVDCFFVDPHQSISEQLDRAETGTLETQLQRNKRLYPDAYKDVAPKK